MKQYSDTISMELSFAEISRITTGLVLTLDRHIKFNSPVIIVENYVETIKKFNDVLKTNEFDYYTDEKFKEYERYISEHK